MRNEEMVLRRIEFIRESAKSLLELLCDSVVADLKAGRLQLSDIVDYLETDSENIHRDVSYLMRQQHADLIAEIQ